MISRNALAVIIPIVLAALLLISGVTTPSYQVNDTEATIRFLVGMALCGIAFWRTLVWGKTLPDSETIPDTSARIEDLEKRVSVLEGEDG